MQGSISQDLVPDIELMITELVSALLAVRVQITTIHEIQETRPISQQDRQVVKGRTSEIQQMGTGRISQSQETYHNLQEDKTAIIQEIHKVFREKASEAESVFRCESNLEAHATSETGDFGIGQINLKAHWNKIQGQTREDKIANLFDYHYNLALSYQLYLAQSWQPWMSSKHCWNT